MLGVYSISPGTIEFARVPANLTKKRGRYDVPVFRLRCVAVDRSVQGQGLGGDLLLASRERALAVASQVGGVALTIDAKDTKRRAGCLVRGGQEGALDEHGRGEAVLCHRQHRDGRAHRLQREGQRIPAGRSGRF